MYDDGITRGSMFVTTPGADRWRLGFAEAVKSNFAFVIQYGLKLVQEGVTLVRYQSQTVILTVYHGRGSYELGIEFEKLDSPRERFNLYEMLQWAKEVGKLEEIPTAGYQVNSREAVYRGVTRLAELVSKYGGPLLEGDADTYQALQVQQASDSGLHEGSSPVGAPEAGRSCMASKRLSSFGEPL